MNRMQESAGRAWEALLFREPAYLVRIILSALLHSIKKMIQLDLHV